MSRCATRQDRDPPGVRRAPSRSYVNYVAVLDFALATALEPLPDAVRLCQRRTAQSPHGCGAEEALHVVHEAGQHCACAVSLSLQQCVSVRRATGGGWTQCKKVAVGE